MLPRLSVEGALDALKAGSVVVFPTETSYGLGGRALDEGTGARVVAAKGRPEGKPLPVLLPNLAPLRAVETPLIVLAEAFWPGPLTLVVPAFPGLPGVVTADTNMVGVRMSANPIAQALVAGLGEPLIATSANRSGEPAAATLAACDAAGFEGVAGVVDGGDLAGTASTVVALKNGQLHLYREGPISEAALHAVWDPLRL